jgi:hypothetical protein
MNINVTFVIQMIHFVIVYMVLKRFFFKGIVSVLQEREKTKQKLTAGLKDKETSLVSLQEEKKKDVVIFRDMLHEKYTFASETSHEIPTGAFYQKDEARLVSIAERVEQLIVEKAPHAF